MICSLSRAFQALASIRRQWILESSRAFRANLTKPAALHCTCTNTSRPTAYGDIECASGSRILRADRGTRSFPTRSRIDLVNTSRGVSFLPRQRAHRTILLARLSASPAHDAVAFAAGCFRAATDLTTLAGNFPIPFATLAALTQSRQNRLRSNDDAIAAKVPQTSFDAGQSVI